MGDWAGEGCCCCRRWGWGEMRVGVGGSSKGRKMADGWCSSNRQKTIINTSQLLRQCVGKV